MTEAKQWAIRSVSPVELRQHPDAHLVPDMRPSEWRDFYADIAFRGITVPLEILADGTVLDGRHRLRAALELSLPRVPVIDAMLGEDDPATYMIKAAVLRRHLTDAQRAAMSVMWAAEHKQQGERTDLTSAGRVAEVSDHPTRAAATSMFASLVGSTTKPLLSEKLRRMFLTSSTRARRTCGRVAAPQRRRRTASVSRTFQSFSDSTRLSLPIPHGPMTTLGAGERLLTTMRR